MHRESISRTLAFTLLVLAMVLGMATAAFAVPSITQTPNFNDQTWAAGSQKTITWTSAELPPGDTLTLTMQHFVDGAKIKVLATGLPQNGSITITVPNDIGTGYPYMLFLGSSSEVYSDAVNDPWLFTLDPAPVVATPASSAWSLGLAAFVALGLMVAVPSVRRLVIDRNA
jgi:hypothetical protein